MNETAPTRLKPAVLVIFGITGDLAGRKVLPALYHLFQNGLVHDHTYLVGTSRRQVAVDEIIDHLRSGLETEGTTADEAVLERLRSHFSMIELATDNDDHYEQLARHLQGIEDNAHVCLDRLFYLSIPPQVFADIVPRLGAHGLNKGCAHGTAASRLLVEKPFGYDLQSAEQLIAETAQHFSEQQIFRIDHYLAKEMAQNILAFRRANPLFADIWNRRHITKISITTAEKIGIEGRANFYDHVGALRDQVQNHLMQLLTLTLMEIPEELTTRSVHAAKIAVLDNLLPVPADQIEHRAIRGQYASYAAEVGHHTTTETYAAVVLYSQDPNWEGVPLQLTTGKALKKKRSSITVDFGDGGINRLQFRLQPDEGISLTFQVKQPGLGTDMESRTMDFSYDSAFQGAAPLDAYERVLIEAFEGDQLLFTTDAEVLSSWRLLQPLLDAWGQPAAGDLVLYENGSDGPDVSDLAGR